MAQQKASFQRWQLPREQHQQQRSARVGAGLWWGPRVRHVLSKGRQQAHLQQLWRLHGEQQIIVAELQAGG
jgi:hypothetical protein